MDRRAARAQGQRRPFTPPTFPLAASPQEKLNPILAAEFHMPNLVAEAGGRSPSVLNGGLEQGIIPSAVITFGAPAGSECTITEQQPTFILHFFKSIIISEVLNLCPFSSFDLWFPMLRDRQFNDLGAYVREGYSIGHPEIFATLLQLNLD